MKDFKKCESMVQSTNIEVGWLPMTTSLPPYNIYHYRSQVLLKICFWFFGKNEKKKRIKNRPKKKQEEIYKASKQHAKILDRALEFRMQQDGNIANPKIVEHIIIGCFTCHSSIHFPIWALFHNIHHQQQALISTFLASQRKVSFSLHLCTQKLLSLLNTQTHDAHSLMQSVW